jgi:uncharacterized membrane protein
MAAITESVEIARSPEDVFAYLDDLARHPEWQDQLESVRVVTDGATHVGTRALETRRLGRRRMSSTYEITEHDPPRIFAFRALDGPVRPVGRGTVEPVGEGRSRLSVELDLEGHGFGKLLVPLARRQAAKQVPKDQQRLKELLESGVT